jgi:hypothetical protein
MMWASFSTLKEQLLINMGGAAIMGLELRMNDLIIK